MTDRDRCLASRDTQVTQKLDRQAWPRKPEGLSAAVPDGSVWPATRAHACWSLVAPFLTARSAIAIAASDFFSGNAMPDSALFYSHLMPFYGPPSGIAEYIFDFRMQTSISKSVGGSALTSECRVRLQISARRSACAECGFRFQISMKPVRVRICLRASTSVSDFNFRVRVRAMKRLTARFTSIPKSNYVLKLGIPHVWCVPGAE